MDSSRVELDVLPEGLSLNPFGWAEIEAAAPHRVLRDVSALSNIAKCRHLAVKQLSSALCSYSILPQQRVAAARKPLQ